GGPCALRCRTARPCLDAAAACPPRARLHMMRFVMQILWRAGAAMAGVAIVVLALGGPGLSSDFMTESVDSARTGWVRDETVFTTANVGSARLLWRLGLESTPRAMHNL